MRRRRTTVAAFTLLEIAIALSLLVVLAAFAWPALEGRIIGAAMPESAARMRDLMGMARNVAMEETRRVRIRFAPNEQQPYVEIEQDPILQPGVWTTIEDEWARDAMSESLLEGVNVYEVRLGRPEFTKPISLNETPELDQDEDTESFATDDDEDALDESEGTENFDATSLQSGFDDSDENLDEDRPLIIFESDGSTPWALLVITRTPLDEELEDDDPRLWVLVDGRTGIPSVRDAMTDEELLDPDADIYVIREDLYLPDLSDLGRLSFQSTGFGGQPGLDEDGDGIPDGTGEDGLTGDGFADDIEDAANGVVGNGDGGGGSDAGDDPLPPELEDSLNDSDLSDEERANIRNALNGRGGGR